MPNPTLLSVVPSRRGKRPLIGMIHLGPLPGSPRYDGDWRKIEGDALRDVRALAAGGASGIMLENFGDLPFYPGRVPAHVVASITAIACAVRKTTDLPIG